MTTYIIGGGHEALNSAILLASLDMPVTVVCADSKVKDTLHHYKFDRQMAVLWAMYRSEQKIAWCDDVATLPQGFDDARAVWLFSDELTDEFCTDFAQKFAHIHSHIIISGNGMIGKVSSLADKFKSPWVFYLPFIFMKDGANFGSLFHPDLVLIGEKTADSHLQSPILTFLMRHADKTHVADIKTVEFARSSIMAMLATRLSLMNELARLADSEGVNIKDVQAMMGKDGRVGGAYLSAGWGFGGKSLPNELSLLTQKFKQNQVSTSLIDSVVSINENQKELIFRKFWRYFDGFIEQKNVVIWGAGYRNGTGRTTNSAIHPLLKLLWSYDIKTTIYSNNTLVELQELYGDNPLLTFSDDPYVPLKGADSLFVINWSPIISPDIHRLNQVRLPIFDAKNILSDADVAQYQGVYFGVGREKRN